VIYQYAKEQTTDVVGVDGYWFYLCLPKSELAEIRQWCETTLGLATKAIKSDENSCGMKKWKPEDASRNWSFLVGYGSTMFLIFWKKESAALFMIGFDTTPIDYREK
jgi:hypothetical protein